MGNRLMYRVVFHKKAKKFVDGLPKQEKTRIVTAIEQLPHIGDIKKLQGHSALYRLRVGKYRIIYTVDNNILVIYIIDIGNRGEIYNRY